MKTKLFAALKQKYSVKTGLSDEVIQAYADSLAATGLVTDENLSTVVDAQETALKKYQSALDQERNAKTLLQKQHEDYKKANPENGGEPAQKEPTDEPAWFAKYRKEQDQKLEELKSENKKSADEKAKQERASTILSKAKALKISQVRIDEGFSISDDLDEAGIDAYLAKVAQKDVARSLPKENDGFGLSTSDKMLEDIAAASVASLPDVKP